MNTLGISVGEVNVKGGPDRQAHRPGMPEILLAIAPLVLILLAEVLPMLLVSAGLLSDESKGIQGLRVALVILMIVGFLGALFLAQRQKWPAWSASWFPFFVLAPLVVISGLANNVFEEDFFFAWVQPIGWYLVFPLAVATLLYIVVRWERRYALLAALPVLYILWLPNMEMVKDSIEAPLTLVSGLLICLAIFALLCLHDWRHGLYIVLGVNLLVGALYSYAGIYHGGMLPFTASGPNLLEVARSLVWQYLAMSALIVGPLLAWKLRQAGRSAGRSGRTTYHLALAGLLWIIVIVLATIMTATNNMYRLPFFLTDGVLAAESVLGLGLFLAGVLQIYREGGFESTGESLGPAALLTLALLVMPATPALAFITNTRPVSNLYGLPLLWEIPHFVSLLFFMAWLGLSVWVVSRPGKDEERL